MIYIWLLILFQNNTSNNNINNANSNTPGAKGSNSLPLDKDVRSVLTAIGRRVATIKNQYALLNKQSKQYKCYSLECDTQSNSACYSPVCLQRTALRKELLMLLRKANTARSNNIVPTPGQFISFPFTLIYYYITIRAQVV